MLKAEQIPDEVVNAYMEALVFSGVDGAAAIAAAINAWPGMQTIKEDDRVTTAAVYLPLPQEARDESHLRPDRRTNVAERLFGDE